jgi:electron transport complex protein RnfG
LKRAVLVASFLFFGLISVSAPAKVFVTLDEALKMAFPDCEMKKTNFYLTKDQVEEAKNLSGSDVDSSLLLRYEGVCKSDDVSGYAYVDTHRVRTQPESILVVLNKDKTVRKIEILTFNEPTEYIPKPKWYEQFEKQAFSDDLQIKRGISPVTGASLTARATTQAVRRVLALDQVVSKK